MGRRKDGVSPPAIVVARKSSDGLKYERRKPHANTTATTVVPVRAQAIQRRSAIAAAARPPGDAERVEEHPRRMPREADRRLLVVDQPERLAADPAALLPRPDQDLGPRSRHAAPHGAALPEVSRLADEGDARREIAGLDRLARVAAVVDDDQLRLLAEPLVQEVRRLGGRLPGSRALVVEGDHQGKG